MRLKIALFFLLASSCAPNAKAQPPLSDRQAITEKLLSLEVEEPNRYQPVRELFNIDPQIGFEVLRDNWSKIRSVDAKLALINTFLATANPNIVEVTYLGATDSSLLVQNFALSAAESVSFRAFIDDFEAYLAWRKAVAGKSLTEVLNAGVRSFVKSYDQADEATREQMLGQLVNKNYLSPTRIAKARRNAAIEAGLMERMGRSLAPNAPANIQQLAFQFCRAIRPDEAFLRKTVLPLCAKEQPIATRMQAISLLGHPDNTWATRPLLTLLLEEYPEQLFYNIGQVLGMIGDAQAIPTLIAMLEADNTREASFAIGNILSQVTGVQVQEGHDAAWWKEWWRKNRARLPESIRNAPFPKVVVRKRQQAQIPNNAAPALTSLLRQADGTPQSSYWFLSPGGRIRVGGFRNRGNFLNQVGANGIIRAEVGGGAKEGLLGLIIVLAPGAGNGALQLDYWTAAIQEQLKGRFAVALPIAPHWGADQKTAWLTNGNRKLVKEAKFSTEEFVANIVKDASANYNIDRSRIFLYGYQDSGIAAYACSLEPQTPVQGFVIAGGAFKSAQLPALKAAKGRRYAIFHSKTDKANSFLTASVAEKTLNENGAKARLTPANLEASGGLPLIELVAGIEWLEKQGTP